MGRTIALIDDSKVMRSIFRKSIMMSDLDVTSFIEASDGNEGLRMLLENRDDIDLIITDLHMPGIGGVELLSKMHDTGYFTDVPIVVISTDINESTQQHCRQYGVRRFLAKPFSQDDVARMLDSVLPGPQFR